MGQLLPAELFLIRSLSPKKSSFSPKYSCNAFCSFWDNISQICAYLPQVRAAAMKKGFVMLCTLIRIPLALKKMRPEFFIVSWYTSKYLNNTNTASLRPAGKDIACLRLLKHVGLEGVNHQQQIWTLFNTSAKKKVVFIRTESKEERKGYHWRKYSCVFTPLLTAFISSFLLSWFGFLVYWFSPGLFLPYYFCLFSKLFLNSYFDYRHSSCYFLLILNFWFFSNMIVFMFLF